MKPNEGGQESSGNGMLSREYIYSMTLHECLYNHPYESIRAMLNLIHSQFAFDMNHFYFCLTGVRKDIYNGVYGLQAEEYMQVFSSLKEQIQSLLAANNWAGDVFLVWKEDEKLIAILMSPQEEAKCEARILAEVIHALVQQSYIRHVFKGDHRFSNTTALSEMLSGYSSIREGYMEVRQIHDIAFFMHLNGTVFTQSYMNESRNDADYASVLDHCFELRNFIDKGDDRHAQKLLKHLFLDIIRNSYNLALCDDALSFLKNMLQIRFVVYQPARQPTLETLCSRKHYHTVDACMDALSEELHEVCGCIQSKGSYSKSVLSAIYYIKMHFMSYLTLEEIAHYGNINASYLSGLFKKETGLSMKNYITMVRLNEAQRLLLATHDTVQSISRQVGFEDTRYFTRIFKQSAGMTPTEYRRQKGTPPV